MQRATLTVMLVAGLLGSVIGCASAPRERAIVWDVLKWKTGDAASAPLIEKGDVVLRGQGIRTKRTYSVPLAVEFEAQLDKRDADGGIFACGFVPTGQSTNAEPEQFVAVMLQYSSTNDTLVVMRRSGKPAHAEAILAQPLTHPAGKPYRLRIEAAKDGMRITLSGQSIVVPDAKVPYDKFHIEFSTVPVSDRWRVRIFVVR